MSTVQNGHRLFGSVKPLLFSHRGGIRPADLDHTSHYFPVRENNFCE